MTRITFHLNPITNARSIKKTIKTIIMGDSLYAKSIKIFCAVAAYWFVSICLVFTNKYLISDKELKLDAVFFVTWYQCVVTVFLCFVLSIISKLFPSLLTFPEFKIELDLCKKVLPLSVVFICMISCNNLCLKYVGVAFYYIGRSLSTVFNVILTRLILKEKTSLSAITCCSIIIGGFLMGVNQEGVAGTLSIIGVTFGLGASLFVASYSIVMKKVLPVFDENIWKLTMYNNIMACILFLPIMVITGEINTVINFPFLFNLRFWCLMTVGGLFGFAIGYVTGLQIKITSPLTHNISGTAKACAQTVIATYYFVEVKPILWWVSNFVVLFGSAAYTQVRRLEMKVKHALQEKETERNINMKTSLITVEK